MRIRAAWQRYLVVSLGLTTIFLFVTCALWPLPWPVAVEYLVLPERDIAFGFGGGIVLVGEGEYAAPVNAKVQYGLRL